MLHRCILLRTHFWLTTFLGGPKFKETYKKHFTIFCEDESHFCGPNWNVKPIWLCIMHPTFLRDTKLEFGGPNDILKIFWKYIALCYYGTFYGPYIFRGPKFIYNYISIFFKKIWSLTFVVNLKCYEPSIFERPPIWIWGPQLIFF